MFSMEWKKHWPSQAVKLNCLHFISEDQTHIVFSCEFEIAGAGLSKDDAHCKLIATLSGLLNLHLLTGGPPTFKPANGGNAFLKKQLKSIGWIFADDGPGFIMPDMKAYVARQPKFNENVLQRFNVTNYPIEIDLPKF